VRMDALRLQTLATLFVMMLAVFSAKAVAQTLKSIPNAMTICTVSNETKQSGCVPMILAGMDHVSIGGVFVVVNQFDQAGISIVVVNGNDRIVYTGKVEGSVAKGTFAGRISGDKSTGTWNASLPPNYRLGLPNSPGQQTVVATQPLTPDNWWFCAYVATFSEGPTPLFTALVLSDLFQSKDLKSESIDTFKAKLLKLGAKEAARWEAGVANDHGLATVSVTTSISCYRGTGDTPEHQKLDAENALKLSSKSADRVLGLHWQAIDREDIPLKK
jgi:hypothetical protein